MGDQVLRNSLDGDCFVKCLVCFVSSQVAQICQKDGFPKPKLRVKMIVVKTNSQPKTDVVKAISNGLLQDN